MIDLDDPSSWNVSGCSASPLITTDLNTADPTISASNTLPSGQISSNLGGQDWGSNFLNALGNAAATGVNAAVQIGIDSAVVRSPYGQAVKAGQVAQAATAAAVIQQQQTSQLMIIALIVGAFFLLK